MMRGGLIILLILGWIWPGHAQDHFSIRNYTAIDGLPQSQVTSLIEDGNGYLWLGTQGGGMARFDGRDFKVYTTLDGLLNNFVLDFHIDSTGSLWILHHRGVSVYDGKKFTRIAYNPNKEDFGFFRRIVEYHNTLYALTNDGTFARIDQDSIRNVDPFGLTNKLKMFHKIPKSDDLIFYLDNGVMVTTKGKKIVLNSEQQNAKFFNFFNYKDNLYIKSTDGKCFQLDFEEYVIREIPLEVGPYVLQYEEKQDAFWARDADNLYKQSVKNDKITIDTVLHDTPVTKILTDSEGNTWFGTDGLGLYKYFYQDFDRCSSDHLRGVMAIHVDQTGASWIGTMSQGLWKIKKGKISSYVREPMPGKLNGATSILETEDGTIWVASGFGLGKYDRVKDEFKWYSKEEGLTAVPLRLAIDKRERIWIGTPRGLYYLEGQRIRHMGADEGMPEGMISTLSYMKSKDILFVASESEVKALHNGKVTCIATPELDNTMILSMTSYNDSLMLLGSSGSGVLIYNPETAQRRVLTRKDGLTSDFIYFVAQDEEGKIWIGMEKGISKIKLNDKLEIVENLHYDYENGLTGMETNQNAFYLSKEHKYFGLIDGLYQLNDFTYGKEKSFDLHLTDIQILYGEYKLEEYADDLSGAFKIPVNPTLPYDKNHLTFYFNRVDKRYPKSVKFKYYLENFDKTWSQPSSMNQVTYSNLPPGEYIFKVMATNNEGSWSKKAIAYPFSIRAPFYQTASFIAAVIIFVAGSITLLMYLRVRQKVHKTIETERIRMREIENLRKEIARDFHDEMGNQLTRIINYVSLLKLRDSGEHNRKLWNDQSDIYKKVEESAKYLYAGTRDFIWAIDPVNDELTKLFIHIRDFGEKLFEEKKIEFRAYDEVKECIKLPNGFSREANLIFKEAMTNAFKYSHAKNVRFSLQRVNSHFEMAFEDDGYGFDLDHTEKSNGLRNITTRAEKIGARLSIRSNEQKGTSISLEFSLTKQIDYGHAI